MLAKKLPIFTMKWPVKNAATRISYGGLLMPGVTAETDLGVLIQAASAALGLAGRIKKDFPTTVTDTLVDGTVWNLFDVELWSPAFVDVIEYSQTDTMAVASTSTTTVTITSLEDNIDTSWLYGVSGLAAGVLTFVQTSASGSCVTKTASGWDSTTAVIKILRLFHRLGKIASTAGKPDMLGTDAAAGSWTIRVMNNKMLSNGVWSYLDPTKHDGLTGLTAAGVATKFYAEVVALSSLCAVAS